MKTVKLFSLLFAFMFASATLSAQDDWANLKHFQDANQAVGQPRPGDTRVVFMGNFLTIVWIDKCPDFFKNRTYLNRGISGQTNPQLLLLFLHDVIVL